MTSRSPKRRRTTASSSSLTRRRFLGGALALPAAAAIPSQFVGRAAAAVFGPEPRAGAALGPGQASPYAVVLGTAQDAGVPQVNCFSDNCNAVRRGERPAPRVSSIGLVDPAADKRFIFDATPDFASQVGELLAHPPGAPPPSGSVPLEEHLHGIFLTHAHMGHYTGLIHLGREGAAARGLPLYVSGPMASYLGANEPWAFLVRNEHVRLVELEPGVRIALTDSLAVTAFDVVHRQEFTDTLGFLIHGPERTLMFVPDADVWEGWKVPFEQLFERSDVALIDGSFFSYDELGHRPQGDVPHPPVVTSIDLLGDRRGDREVWFIHLNNTNPLWDPDSRENEVVGDAGFGVAHRGQIFGL